MRTPAFFLLFLVAIPLVMGRAPAQTLGQGDDARRYGDCIAHAATAPEDAFESASAWRQEGGGDAAEHCAAVALLSQGLYRQAAKRLEALAEAMAAGTPDLLADILGQAGQAWMLADDSGRAHAAQSAALELAPDNVELLIDRSFALAQARNYWEAIDDLNRAAELAPERHDILVYRASAYRFVEAFDIALDDANAALALAPDDLEGLLERGILRRLTGDPDGARQDWLRVVNLAGDSAAAEAARGNLERLDVKTE